MNNVLLKCNALYFTRPQPKKYFSNIMPFCLLFIADSRKYDSILVRSHDNRSPTNIQPSFVDFWGNAMYSISDFVCFNN